MNLTIGIISCNRFKYLKSLIKSLKCLKDVKLPSGGINKISMSSKIEIIVVDNGSKEAGLKEYLEKEHHDKFIDELFLREDRDWKNDEYHAKNLIIKKSKHDVIFFLQDDLSFIGTPNQLEAAYNAFNQSDALCMDMCGVRNTTVFRKIDYTKQFSFDGFKYWGTKTNHFQTMGLFKKFVFTECDYYPVGKKFSSWKWDKDDTIQQEDYYSYLVKEKFLKTKKTQNVTVLSHVPLFITVWNDPRGGYAFVRDNKRYGHYIEANDKSDLYYKHLSDKEIERLMSYRFPSGFTNVAKPIGWDYCKTPKGEQEKYDRNKIVEEGPISNV